MNQKDIETLAIALPEDILKAKWCGDFDRAFHLIDLYLANEKVPAFMKTRLALEREVLKALPTGYTYSEEDALALVQKEIPDFTKAELDALRDRGAIDWIYINGKTTYSRTFYDTLLGVYPDIATRAGKPPKDKSDRVEFLRQNVRDMKKDGDALWSIQLRAQFRLHDDVFRPGEELTVHLPVPKNAMNMRDIEILATSHPIYKLADENAPARTVSFRGKFEKNETFWVEYKYLSYVKYNNLESAQVSAEQPTFDTEELYPHIRFTPLIRALCKELSGDEKNPLLLAHSFYNYCTKVGTYSYVRILHAAGQHSGLLRRGAARRLRRAGAAVHHAVPLRRYSCPLAERPVRHAGRHRLPRLGAVLHCSLRLAVCRPVLRRQCAPHGRQRAQRLLLRQSRPVPHGSKQRASGGF